MKTIKIKYIEVNKALDNTIMEISLDYPKFRHARRCYLHELNYFDEIIEKINKETEDKIIFSQSLYCEFFIKITDESLDSLREYFLNKTEYEEHKFNDDLSLLKALVDVYRNNPKTWET